jgi:integrase/recombinase XerD
MGLEPERAGLFPLGRLEITPEADALLSLLDDLCEKNAIATNPVDGVRRPKADMNEGKTPAISDGQARVLLATPPADTLKGQRDRAILATFLFHGLRLDELLKLRPKDMHQRQGVIHLRIRGKGSKTRYVPAHPAALEAIDNYLGAAGQRDRGHQRPGQRSRHRPGAGLARTCEYFHDPTFKVHY